MFIKLHITAQSGPVILVILCHSHRSSQGGINVRIYVSVFFIELHITAPSGPVILCHLHCSSQGRIKAYACVFIKLNITAQSGPAILKSFYATRIDPLKGGSMLLITKTSDQTQQRGQTLSLLVQFLLKALSALRFPIYSISIL